MNKKAESVYTSRIINQNAHQARKAARMARRQARALQNSMKPARSRGISGRNSV